MLNEVLVLVSTVDESSEDERREVSLGSIEGVKEADVEFRALFLTSSSYLAPQSTGRSSDKSEGHGVFSKASRFSQNSEHRQGHFKKHGPTVNSILADKSFNCLITTGFSQSLGHLVKSGFPDTTVLAHGFRALTQSLLSFCH